MRKRIGGLVIVWLVCGCALASNAGDPPILITEPLVIDEPGSYILSRDIAIDWNSPGSPLIVTASDVDIDFGNHRVTGQFGTGDPVVLVFGDRVRLHNGTIRGDREDPPAIRVINTIGFVIEDMLLDSGGGVQLDNVSGFLLSDLVIVHGFNTAVYGTGSQGSILSSDVFHIGGWGGAFGLSGHDIVIRDNKFFYTQGWLSVSGSKIDVVDNSMGNGWTRGIEIEDCEECSLRRNRVEGRDRCFHVQSNGTIVEGNECYLGGSVGMRVTGSGNLLRDNLMVGENWGVGFAIDGDDNRHCGNRVRDYPVDIQDSGSGNRPCADIEPIVPECALGPLGQVAMFQQSSSCSSRTSGSQTP